MKRIALILENMTWSFDAALAEALGRHCLSAGIQLVLYETRYGAPAQIAANLNTHGLQGAVLLTDSISLAESMDSIRQFISILEIPAVTVGLRVPGTPCVMVDNQKGMELLVDHLFAQGARRIAHITGPSFSREATRRKEAYLHAMAAHGQPVAPDWIVEGIFSPVSGYHALLKLMPIIHAGEIDAVLFANDESACGGLRLLEAEGIHVPGDLKAAGYGDTPLGLLSTPGLTTISNNPDELAREALRLLSLSTGRTTGESAEVSMVEPRLLPNLSTGAPTRSADRMALLRRHPLANLHKPEFFTDTLQREAFFAELRSKLEQYLVPAFYVVRYQSPQPQTPYEVPRPLCTLLFGYEDNQEIHSGLVFSPPALLPEDCPRHEGKPLVFKNIQFAELPFGYLLTSPEGANADYLEDICRHCIGWLEADHRLHEHQQVQQRITDTLTQLSIANRQLNELRVRSNLDGTAYPSDRLSNGISSGTPNTSPEQTQYIILLLDIDGLRHINLRYGYEEGDKVLELVEVALSRCVREQDRVVRQGGDSFMLLVKQSGPDMVDVLQQRLIAQLDRLNRSMDKGYRIDFTWGYACGTSSETFERVIQRADEMLYRKKRERISINPQPRLVMRPQACAGNMCPPF